MTKGKALGVYLGAEGVGVAELDKKKLCSVVYMPFSVLEEEVAAYDELSPKIKTEALLQRAIRKIKAESSDAVVALAEKELTFRMIDMPLLKKKELELALPLEVEKYIPFKIEDVSWGFKERNIAKEKKTQVAFLSAKREPVEEAKDILTNINLRTLRCDSASLSSVDLLFQLNKLPKKNKDFVVLFYGGAEAEICIFDNKFPKFNRYTKVPVDFEGNFNVRKFIDDVRLTLEYYKREAGRINLEKIYVIANELALEGFKTVSDDLNIPSENIALEGIVESQRISTVYELKAYALAMRAFDKQSVGFNLIESEELASSGALEKDIMTYFKAQAPDAPFDPRPSMALLALGAMAFVAVNFSSQASIIPLQKRLSEMQSKLKEANVKVAQEPELNKELKRLQGYNKQLKNIKLPQKNASEVLSAIGENLSEGLWFSSLKVSGDEQTANFSYVIDGYVYVDSPDIERESLNQWVEALKQSEIIKKENFSVSIEYIERAVRDNFSVTKFQVTVRKNG